MIVLGLMVLVVIVHGIYVVKFIDEDDNNGMPPPGLF